MTMPAFCPNPRAPQVKGPPARKKHRGGCPGDSGTEKPSMPMPSAFTPSHPLGRFGTGVGRSRTRASAIAAFALGADLQQLGRGVAEDIGLLSVAERAAGEDVVDRVELPRIGIVAAEHDLAGADLRHQMADRFRGE